MSVIYKYPLQPYNSVQWLTVSSSSTIISAIEQDGQIVVYALIPDPDAEPVWDQQKRMLVLGTGQYFNADRENSIKPFEELRFINTVKVDPFVWHVFELMELKVE
jgi:hypothetical protein